MTIETRQELKNGKEVIPKYSKGTLLGVANVAYLGYSNFSENAQNGKNWFYLVTINGKDCIFDKEQLNIL